MANFLQETNLAITKFNLNKAGELTDLEINGKNIDLSTEVKLQDNKEVKIDAGEVEITPDSGYDAMKKVTASVKLYAWTNDEGADQIWAYTLSETPAVGDTAIIPALASYSLEDDSITAIGEDTITISTTEFQRDNTKDIEF